jgi:hypothetical protein
MNHCLHLKKGQYLIALLRSLLCVFLFLPTVSAQFNFNISALNGASITNPTSLQFGPDNRLYVAQQNGIIKAFKVVKNAPGNYSVTATETISLINQIPNHNDDGSLAPTVTTRQITGILVAGTAANPMIYVSSSDSRVGGPSGKTMLDTNSGIVSLLSWNGTAWTKIDLVRGLPRSEENHSPNGMQLIASTNTLLLAEGGITNAGSPSTNFNYACEFAYSAAILSINLNAINAMPTQGSGNTAFKYDLPTVDDPNRSNVGSNDVNDPFGGDEGLNMAKIVPGGPVQVYAPGFRNAYDLVITQAGRLYTIDNGANQGWGGYPDHEGPAGNATNNYVPGEPGSTGPGVLEPQVNDLDGLHYIGNVATYTPNSYYGGHPNPIRCNPSGAGLYTYNGTSGVWRTGTSGANPLPVDWPPVSTPDPRQGDFLMPGSSVSPDLMTFTNSTNGTTEYTASNFNNGMKGDLVSVDYNGNMWLIKLTADGTGVTNAKNPTTKLIQDAPLATNFGNIPLDVTAQGDGSVFPGTMWVAIYQDGAIKIFEPNDAGTCTGLYNNADDDGDCYTNADEVDNHTNPCSAASRPPDFNHNCISDLNDPDDDSDGIPDSLDHFAIDASNGLATQLPVHYDLLSNNPGTGFFGLGFTGLMSNGHTNYLKQYDPNNLVAGGAAGVLSIVAVSPKDALGATNNQENAFQFGINVSSATGQFTVDSRILGPFFGNQTPTGSQSQGIYIGTGDQSNYLKIVLNANGGVGGIQVVTENADVPVSTQYGLGISLASISTLDLYLTVNPVLGTVKPGYAINGGAITYVGSPITVSGALLNTIRGSAATAVGVIATSAGGSPFTASWDYIYVTADAINTTWTNIAPSNTPKWVGFSIMYNNKMYVFSGFDTPDDHTTPHVEVYDPVTNTWTYAADMPTPVTHAGITQDGALVYVAGGFVLGTVGGPNTNLLQIYNITTNTWSTGPALPMQMGGLGLVRVGRKLHAFGGLLTDRQTGNTAHFVLDLNNMAAGWTTAAATPNPRCHFASAFVAGKIYVLGGQVGHDVSYHDVNLVNVYDPSTDTWSQNNNMPYVRSHSDPATFVMEGKVYLVGGRSGPDTNILGNVTYYDPAADTWTEDVPLPAGIRLFAPAAEAIGNELFVSNGGLNQCCAPQTAARKRGIARVPNLKIGFLPSALNLIVASNGTISKNVILWTLSGSPAYTISGLPSWLTATPSSGNIDLLGGTEITLNINAAGLTAGNYAATLTAKAAGYPDASLQINLTVTQANVKALYVYGSVPPAQVDMKLTDTSSTGLSQFAQALQQVGFNFTQTLDANVTLNAATLNLYKVLILGSNNRRFTAAEQAAVAAWVNAGGGLVAWSDAAFGWANGGVNSYAGQQSDNDLTQQFGMQFLHDNGGNVFTMNQWAVDHYIDNFNKNGGLSITAEGISPVRTTAPATILAQLPAGQPLNTLDGPVTAADAVLSVAKPGQGRVACYCDRNTFWNSGEGTRLSDANNKVFAQRLILWASGVNDQPPVTTTTTYRINAGGPQVTNTIGTFAADQYYSTPSSTYSVTTGIAGTTNDAIYQDERSASTDNGTFSYAFPVPNGTYTVVLHFAEIYWTTVGARLFDVSIENTKVLDNYDIVKKVGPLTATTETFTTTVTDGMLNIFFSAAVADGGKDRPTIEAIEVLPVTTPPPPPTTYRINAGGPQVTNSIGTFAADQYFTTPSSTYSVTSGIAGTTDDAIYQDERSASTDNGSFSYAFPVSNGTYKVILHFAEIYWTTVGARLFDVSIEGNKVLHNYDIVKKVGPLTATTETFTANVTDGMLNIDFSALLADGDKDRPTIEAIEILTGTTGNQPPVANAGQDQTITLPTSTATLTGSGTDADGTIASYAWTKISGSGVITSPSSATTTVTALTQGTSVFQLVVTDNQGAASAPDTVIVTVNPTTIVYRINAGGPQVTNSIGTFAADQYYSTPSLVYSTTAPIAGTTDDAIYQTERYSSTDNGTLNYNFPVSNGTYKVILHFAEIYWTTPGHRLFDVSIEGTKVLDNYDIFAKVGALTATTETFTTTVTDGMLNIYFSALVADGGKDRPKISAIEIISGTFRLTTYVPALAPSDIVDDQPIRVYPNPSGNGQFAIIPGKMLGLVDYSLYSASGTLLKTGRYNRTPLNPVLYADFSKEMISTGIYYLHLKTKDKKTVLKLIKE